MICCWAREVLWVWKFVLIGFGLTKFAEGEDMLVGVDFGYFGKFVPQDGFVAVALLAADALLAAVKLACFVLLACFEQAAYFGQVAYDELVYVVAFADIVELDSV